MNIIISKLIELNTLANLYGHLLSHEAPTEYRRLGQLEHEVIDALKAEYGSIEAAITVYDILDGHAQEIVTNQYAMSA